MYIYKGGSIARDIESKVNNMVELWLLCSFNRACLRPYGRKRQGYEGLSPFIFGMERTQHIWTVFCSVDILRLATALCPCGFKILISNKLSN